MVSMKIRFFSVLFMILALNNGLFAEAVESIIPGSKSYEYYLQGSQGIDQIFYNEDGSVSLQKESRSFQSIHVEDDVIYGIFNVGNIKELLLEFSNSVLFFYYDNLNKRIELHVHAIEFLDDGRTKISFDKPTLEVESSAGVVQNSIGIIVAEFFSPSLETEDLLANYEPRNFGIQALIINPPVIIVTNVNNALEEPKSEVSSSAKPGCNLSIQSKRGPIVTLLIFGLLFAWGSRRRLAKGGKS